jgi:hypothetical protein
MALDANSLASLIKSKLSYDPAKAGDLDKLITAIASAVVEHITTSAVVTTTVAPSQLGVVPPQVGGPVPVAPTPLTGTVT